jgi:hypothetical protein
LVYLGQKRSLERKVVVVDAVGVEIVENFVENYWGFED